MMISIVLFLKLQYKMKDADLKIEITALQTAEDMPGWLGKNHISDCNVL